MELRFTSLNTAAQAACCVDGATMIGLALLIYESPFDDIVSSRAMPRLLESSVIKNIAEILEHAGASTEHKPRFINRWLRQVYIEKKFS